MKTRFIGILLATAMAMAAFFCLDLHAKAASPADDVPCFEWTFGASYSAGDFVRFEGELYRCKTEITIQYYDWTPANPNSGWVWEKIPIVGWEFGVTFNDGDVVEYNGNLYKCLKGYTVQYNDWHPENPGLSWRWAKLSEASNEPDDYWSQIAPLATASNQNASSLKLASDNENLYVRIDGSDLGSVGQLLIDSDNSRSTGYIDYRFSNAGMDYMIEGSNLYYHGTNDNSWTWTANNNSGMVCVKDSSYIEYTVPRSILGNNVAVVFKDVSASYNINGTLPAEGEYVYYSMQPVNGHEAPSSEFSYRSFTADDSHVKVTGRTVYDDNKRWLTFSAGKIEFKFFGTSASIKMRADNGVNNASRINARNHIAMELDGERVIDDILDEPVKDYVVLADDNQQPAWHTVAVIKLSELRKSCCAVEEITVKSDRDIIPAENKELYFEFIGDSITCGWGAVGMEDSTVSEDASRTYAAVCAKELNADFSCVSSSGAGAYSGYSRGVDKNTSDLIPPLYDKTADHAYQYNNNKGDSDPSLVYERNRPFDLCVINLGTNDSSYVRNYTDRRQECRDTYVSFVEHIREKNPNAKIVCTLGLMSVYDHYEDIIKDAVNEYNRLHPDDEIFYFELPSTRNYGYGQGSHPNEAGHEAAGKALAEFVKNNVLNH
jgi:hypothetical protein